MVPAGAAVAACWSCCSCDATGCPHGSISARVPPDRRCPRGLGSESGSVTSSSRPNSGGVCGCGCACCRDRGRGSFPGCRRHCHGLLGHFYYRRRHRRLKVLGGSAGRLCILRMLRSLHVPLRGNDEASNFLHEAQSNLGQSRSMCKISAFSAYLPLCGYM